MASIEDLTPSEACRLIRQLEALWRKALEDKMTMRKQGLIHAIPVRAK